MHAVILGGKILYLHMVGCRQGDFVQQGAWYRTGCRAGRWTSGRTGRRTRLRSGSFGREVLHVSLLQWIWSNLVSITAHEAQGWGWPLSGGYLTACVSPALTAGSYLHSTVEKTTPLLTHSCWNAALLTFVNAQECYYTFCLILKTRRLCRTMKYWKLILNLSAS